jgi:hypothetical protein
LTLECKIVAVCQSNLWYKCCFCKFSTHFRLKRKTMHQLNSTKRARVTSNVIHLPGSRILHYVRFRYIEKMSKISVFVVTPAQRQSCWTVVNSTKSVSTELSDFGLWRQLKVESEIKSPWTLKTILNDIKNILY